MSGIRRFPLLGTGVLSLTASLAAQIATAAVVLTLLCAPPAAAQTTSTEIVGTVTDSTGAVVPNARVTLLRVATGERRDMVTSGTGNYTFPFIEAGVYTVTVQMAGFKTKELEGILVQVQQRARVDFQLEVGASVESVEVTGIEVALKTEDATVSQAMDNKRVVELPLSGRNIAGLAVLTPGVQFGAKMGLNGLGGWPIPSTTISLSANGQRDINMQISLDGVASQDALQNVMYFTPSIDSIQEFRVLTGSYTAVYGNNNGAVVEIALKSGTNQLHGVAFEFLRNDALDAKDYFLNFQLPVGTSLSAKNRLRRNQFGIFLSGPVVFPKLYNGTNRTFWSFNYEGKRQTQEAVSETFWFPQPFRIGDFSALLTPLIRDGRPIRPPIIISDPFTGEAFRNNIVPPSRLNKNAQDFINKYLPLPMFQPDDILDSNVKANIPAFLRSDQYFFRIDHNLGSNDRFFARYVADRTSWDQRFLNPNFRDLRYTGPKNVGFQYLHIFNPGLLNEFRYGYNYNTTDLRNGRTFTDFDPDSLGIGKFRVATDNNRRLTPQETGIPATGVVQGDVNANTGKSGVTQITDNVSLSRGSHSLRTGFEYRWVTIDSMGGNVPIGSLSTSSSIGGYSLAGWLLGLPSASTTGEGSPRGSPRQHRFGAYLQDDWRVTRKLSANLGLRWDFFKVPRDPYGGLRTLRLDILSTASDGRRLPTVVPAPGTKDFVFYENNNGYFMPRIGLAYRATPAWVVRTGFGWYVNAQSLQNVFILSRMPPLSGSFGFSAVTDVAQNVAYSYGGQAFSIQTRRFRQGTDILTLDNPFPGQAERARTALLVFPPDNKLASVAQWSFDIQRSLPWKVFVTIGYVGSKSSHIDNSVTNFNSPDPSRDTNIEVRRPWQAYVSQGEGDRPYGLGTIRYLDSYADSSYQGLQTTVEKRYSSGLTLGLAYTYSKALGTGYERNWGGVGGISNTYQDPRDRRSDYGRMAFDVTHVAVLNYVYEMPFLNRFKGVTGALLAGWQTNGIITVQTGSPFSLGGGNLNTGGPTRPDRIADGRLGDSATRALWYDPTAFRRTDCNIPSHPELCHYGNAGAGSLTTPGMRGCDMSIYKNWRIPSFGEAGRLQFRAEFFNAFNTPQLGQPSGISFTTSDSIVPDGPRMAEIRSLRTPMRIIQFGMKLYF